MARCEDWVPGFFNEPHLSVFNARYAIMYRYVCRKHCDVIPDTNIPEKLTNCSPYPSECDCHNCAINQSRIATVSTIDSSDSLFNVSNGWSEDSIDVTSNGITDSPSEPAVPDTSQSFTNASESNLPSDSQGEQSVIDTEIVLTTESSYLSTIYDDFDSQLFSDSEAVLMEQSIESPGVSFSDAETQWPTDLMGAKLPRLGNVQKRDVSDSDSSSHSVSILKRKK